MTSGAAPGYGYWDTYGAGVNPGGSLRASPSNTGQPRSIPGIDIPATPDPGIANDPVYGNTLGLPRTGGVVIEGGGPGAPGRYPYPDMNIPTNENVSPSGNRFYLNDDLLGAGPSGPFQPFSGDDNNSVINPSYTPPMGGYPVPGFEPGVGYTGGNIDSGWQDNAGSGYGFAGRLRGGLGKFVHSLFGQKLGVTPTGSSWFTPVPGENWIGGGIAGFDPVTGKQVYNPLGTVNSGGFAGQAQQNNARAGFSGFAGTANSIASSSGFGGGLTSTGQGGWQTVTGGIPGAASMPIPAAFGNVKWIV